MIGEGNIWRKAMEDDSILIIQCEQPLNQKQMERLQAQLEAGLEGTGKRAIVLPAGTKLSPPAGPVLLHAEQPGPREPLRVFDQFGRELEGVRMVSVTDREDDVRILQLELVEMHGDDDTGEIEGD